MDRQIISPAMHAWAQASIGRIRRRVGVVSTRRRRRLLIVHLDGVPQDLLEEAIASRKMPFLSALVHSGTYALDTAFWGSPASTPCFQAGLLYGLRHPNLPAYHWFDRELGRVVRMNAPKDTFAIEQRLGAARKESLLSDGGTAYLALFQAHAADRLCMSSLADLPQLGGALARQLKGIRAPRRNGVLSFMRHLASDTWHTGKDVVRWVRRLGDWRHEREYMLNRLFMISLAWELAHSRALVDMARGVPAVYLVFGNYDEVAHRRGPRSLQALRELYRVDAYLAELYAIARTLEQPYDVCFLTDHGHVDSAPLEQRIGKKLERRLLQGQAELPPEVERGLLDGRLFTPASPVQHKDDPVVIEAGNFAHVYLTRSRRPLEAMQLLQSHRQVLARAVQERDIGIVALRRGDSAAAIIGGGVYGPDEVDRSPLAAGFSRRAVADLLRELPHMGTAGDLVLFGNVCQPGGTVGFAWEFGSHGGVTEIETNSVVMWPRRSPLQLAGLGHVTQLHARLSEVYRQ